VEGRQPVIAAMASSRIKKPAKRSQRELRSIRVPFQAATRVRAAGELELTSLAVSSFVFPFDSRRGGPPYIYASVGYATRYRKFRAACVRGSTEWSIGNECLKSQHSIYGASIEITHTCRSGVTASTGIVTPVVFNNCFTSGRRATGCLTSKKRAQKGRVRLGSLLQVDRPASPLAKRLRDRVRSSARCGSNWELAAYGFVKRARRALE
jgi:hypothetical protein